MAAYMPQVLALRQQQAQQQAQQAQQQAQQAHVVETAPQAGSQTARMQAGSAPATQRAMRSTGGAPSSAQVVAKGVAAAGTGSAGRLAAPGPDQGGTLPTAESSTASVKVAAAAAAAGAPDGLKAARPTSASSHRA